MTDKNKVKVDANKCIGCGACVAICPKIFKFNENGKSCVIKQPETADELECAKQAAASCPMEAIKIE